MGHQLDKLLSFDRDVRNVAFWYLATDRNRKRWAMRVGGFQEVFQEAAVTLLNRPPNESYERYSWITLLLHQLDWSLSRLWKPLQKEMIARKGVKKHIRESYVQDFYRRACVEELQKAIDKVLRDLTEREQEIVTLRWGLDGEEPLTLEKIGSIFKVTQRRIWHIERGAIHKLQMPSRAQFLAPHLDSVDKKELNDRTGR